MIYKEDILFAISNTKSNKEAARFLNVSFNTYKKYAKEYIDDETGKTLFELHYNPNNVKKDKNTDGVVYTSYKKLSLDNILVKHQNKLPISDFKLRDMLIDNNYKVDRCDSCGFDTPRITDNRVPLLLTYLDSDKTNKEIDNIQFLCANCYYLYIGDIVKEGEI